MQLKIIILSLGLMLGVSGTMQASLDSKKTAEAALLEDREATEIFDFLFDYWEARDVKTPDQMMQILMKITHYKVDTLIYGGKNILWWGINFKSEPLVQVFIEHLKATISPEHWRLADEIGHEKIKDLVANAYKKQQNSITKVESRVTGQLDVAPSSTVELPVQTAPVFSPQNRKARRRALQEEKARAKQQQEMAQQKKEQNNNQAVAKVDHDKEMMRAAATEIFDFFFRFWEKPETVTESEIADTFKKMSHFDVDSLMWDGKNMVWWAIHHQNEATLRPLIELFKATITQEHFQKACLGNEKIKNLVLIAFAQQNIKTQVYSPATGQMEAVTASIDIQMPAQAASAFPPQNRKERRRAFQALSDEEKARIKHQKQQLAEQLAQKLEQEEQENDKRALAFFKHKKSRAALQTWQEQVKARKAARQLQEQRDETAKKQYENHTKRTVFEQWKKLSNAQIHAHEQQFNEDFARYKSWCLNVGEMVSKTNIKAFKNYLIATQRQQTPEFNSYDRILLHINTYQKMLEEDPQFLKRTRMSAYTNRAQHEHNKALVAAQR